MNVTLLAALLLLAGWITLVFALHNGNGPVHLLYAAGMVLVARRIVAGAPRFLS